MKCVVWIMEERVRVNMDKCDMRGKVGDWGMEVGLVRGGSYVMG